MKQNKIFENKLYSFCLIAQFLSIVIFLISLAYCVDHHTVYYLDSKGVFDSIGVNISFGAAIITVIVFIITNRLMRSLKSPKD